VHQVDGGSLLKLLDVGEAEAIVLAEQKHCPILIDEADGRKIAREKGLMITGLIGVLEVGAELGYIDLAACFAALRQTRFRIHPNILDEALKRLKKPS
jgi:predicted nucleic acid-binding protein